MGRRRVLLLQVRDHREAELQEQNCFLRAGGLAADELVTRNLVAEPRLEWTEVRGADALFIGGAGRHSATREYPFTAPAEAVVGRWLEEKRPFFGSCFGHHFVARLLGGRVITDRDREEVGTFEVELTPEGRDDRLFSQLDDRFLAQFGHHDRVVELPPGARALAHTRRCPNQAIRLAGGVAYTTQFHPEMTVEDMRARLMIYSEGYLETSERQAAVLRSLAPTPGPGTLLQRFIELLG